MGKCRDLSSRKRYGKTSRPRLPPFAAGDCEGETRHGNDGRVYTSRRRGTRCAWVLAEAPGREVVPVTLRALAKSPCSPCRTIIAPSKDLSGELKARCGGRTCSRLKKCDIPVVLEILERESKKVPPPVPLARDDARVGRKTPSAPFGAFPPPSRARRTPGGYLTALLKSQALSEAQIAERRAWVLRQVRAWVRRTVEGTGGRATPRSDFFECNDPAFTRALLLKILKTYDAAFFGGELRRQFQKAGCDVTLVVDHTSRARHAGFVWKDGKQVSMELIGGVFAAAARQAERASGDEWEAPKWNNGILCTSLLSCLCVTFEHELVHVIFDCLGGSSHQRRSGSWTGPSRSSNNHGPRFMRLVNNVFGHTHYLHGLHGDGDAMREFYAREALALRARPGAPVTVYVDGKTRETSLLSTSQRGGLAYGIVRGARGKRREVVLGHVYVLGDR